MTVKDEWGIKQEINNDWLQLKFNKLVFNSLIQSWWYSLNRHCLTINLSEHIWNINKQVKSSCS